MMDRRNSDTRRLLPDNDTDMDLETRAAAICKIYGAGSPEYSKFLEEVNSTLLGSMLDLPKFVPGDVKNAALSKSRRKKKKHHRQRTQQTDTSPMAQASPSPFAVQSGTEEGLAHEVTSGGLERVEEEEEKRETLDLTDSWTVQKSHGRSVHRCQTTDERHSRRHLMENANTLRRSHSSLVSEQTTMDEQVALQLQTLVREKAELIKENSRLKNENEGLKTLLEYATCEATADDGEDSDYETSKEALRQPGIQAWHPPELQSPTSFSSYGMLGSTSSTEDKDPRTSSQASEDVYHLLHVRT